MVFPLFGDKVISEFAKEKKTLEEKSSDRWHI